MRSEVQILSPRLKWAYSSIQSQVRRNRAGLTKAGAVNQFLAPFFAALGWPVAGPDRYKYELRTYAGSPYFDAIVPHDSDLDLLVVKRGAHRRRLAQAIYRRLVSVGRSVDVVVVTPDDLERYRDSAGLVIAPALREGKTIYAA